jgi:hypothetical protein
MKSPETPSTPSIWPYNTITPPVSAVKTRQYTLRLGIDTMDDSQGLHTETSLKKPGLSAVLQYFANARASKITRLKCRSCDVFFQVTGKINFLLPYYGSNICLLFHSRLAVFIIALLHIYF